MSTHDIEISYPEYLETGKCNISFNINLSCFCEAPVTPTGVECPSGTNPNPAPRCNQERVTFKGWTCNREVDDLRCNGTEEEDYVHPFGYVFEQPPQICEDSNAVAAEISKEIERHRKNYEKAVECTKKCATKLDTPDPEAEDQELGEGKYSCRIN